MLASCSHRTYYALVDLSREIEPWGRSKVVANRISDRDCKRTELPSERRSGSPMVGFPRMGFAEIE